MGIFSVSAGILLVCSTGLTLTTVFKFLHNFEVEVGNKKPKRTAHDHNEERLNNIPNRARLNK